MAKVKGNQVSTDLVRFSFVSLAEPGKTSEKYEVTLMIPKTAEGKDTIAKIRQVEKTVYDENKAGKLKGVKLERIKNPLVRDGDEDFDPEIYPDYAGHWIVGARNKRQPKIVDRYKEDIDASEILSGYYGRTIISIFAYAAPEQKGISAGLELVQFIKKGEVMGGSSVSVDDLDDWDDDEDDDDDLLG